MGLKDIGETLPPGFRFYPSDEELVFHYLLKKITNEELLKGTLVEIDLHVCEPWQLPEVAKLNANEWYFFSFRDRKYATGFRTNRATTTGYWKATGKDRLVLDPKTRKVVGMRKTLVFYKNRAPNGIKTGWIMHEFRLETPHMPPKEDWVLCRVFHKSKGGETSNSSSPHQNLDHLFMEVTSTTATGGSSSPHLLLPSPTHEYRHHPYINIPSASASCGGYHDKSSTQSFPSSNPQQQHIRLEMIQQQQQQQPQPILLNDINNNNNSDTGAATATAAAQIQLLNDAATAANNAYCYSPIPNMMMHLIGGGGKNNNGRGDQADVVVDTIHQQQQQYGSLWDINLDEENSGLEGAPGFQHQNHNQPYHHELMGDVTFEDHDGIVLL